MGRFAVAPHIDDRSRGIGPERAKNETPGDADGRDRYNCTPAQGHYPGAIQNFSRVERQRRPKTTQSRAVDHPARCVARPPRSHRHQERLRSRPVRRLHGAGRWPPRQFLPDAGRHEGRRRDHHHRRPCQRRRAASAAAGLHRPRRLPVRLLHAGANLLGGGADRRRQGEDGGRNPRIDERQHLPLRRLSQHRGGDPAGDGQA